MSSGLCNRCRVPLFTGRHTWCKECHTLVVEEFRARCRLPAGRAEAVTGSPVGVLHFGFVFVHETAEMVAILPRGETAAAPRPATGSKIADPAGRVPRPIDRVAARVTGIHDG